MVAAVSETTATTRNQTFLSYENHSDVITPTRPKSTHVSSRYLSPSPSISSNSSSLHSLTPSRRSHSSLTSRNSITPGTKRSLYVDRLRPDRTLKPNNAGAGATYIRSLPVSFQSETFSLLVSKTKITHQSPSFIRKGDHVENTKPMDHHRWPGRIRKSTATVLSKHDPNKHNPDGNSVKDSYSYSYSGVQENGPTRSRIRHNGVIVSPKFWQETNSRIRRLQDPSLNCKRFSSDINSLSSARTNRMTSSPNGMINPRRYSVSGINNNVSETPSVLSFAVDVRRGKVGENRFLDAHCLRLLYNRQLQWRFVNARNEDIAVKRKHSVEEYLWNAWMAIFMLRDSVTRKRHRLQLLGKKLKLASLLKAQMVFLEDWGYLDKNHSTSLLGAIEALKARSLRLPVTAGATVDLQSTKDAINSALDVMQAMGSSSLMNLLCLQVEEVNLLVTKIARVYAKERALLRVCQDFLSVLSTHEVTDCSLRTHMLQTSRYCW